MAWLDTTSVVDSKMEKTLEGSVSEMDILYVDAGGRLGWGPTWLGADLAGGRLGWGPTWLGADLAGGRLGWWHVMIDHRDKSEG